MANNNYQELEKLKSILVGKERKMIEDLIERLDNLDIQSEELCDLLPEAIRRSLQKGNKLNQVFIPLLNEAFKQSIDNDPNDLTQSLYSLIGPATRKSVAEALKTMMQSFNYAMKSTFTLNGLKWRFESIMSGKSYPEVVLLHTLVFQVEQVFLIHKKTGLLLEEARLETAFSRDSDMISSMLRAIQDFVHDSFKLEENESLNTLNVGELTVWVEECPGAVLALVLRGHAPESLRESFSEVIESIHIQYHTELNDFDGDTEPFKFLRPDLKACLYQKTSNDNDNKKPVLAMIILSIVGLLLFTWAGWSIHDSIKWTGFKSELESTTGFIILGDGEREGKRYVSGFKEEFAELPESIWEESGYDSSEVLLLFEPYSSQLPEFVERRARKILNAPESVSFSFQNKILSVGGYAQQSWVDRAKELALVIPGVMELNLENVKVSEGLILDSLVHEIENTHIGFHFNSTNLLSGQKEKVIRLLDVMKKLVKLAKDRRIIIEITGHTCSSGSETRNEKLSWNRARKFLEMLGGKDLTNVDFILKGIGNKSPFAKEVSEQDRVLNRRVSFDVIINRE